ncbi:ribosomal protein S18 acetylase RimI-like enzyme [Friedmanniella endophytica]|uniref:Ribosomal protein S18 acetylase RimI-like enzyme n=1 Tax=Microlunatus kandeliicorticis TaxID=1759536 RepID=A0A7W3IVV2_9ACTN|nr:N-acetyltransferase [Microlunatus kandeliicorticis]MBA8796226.1 ribosomal protein S18 acetylase RimI-like enzyme [Microlunatus kandeliicorticis]
MELRVPLAVRDLEFDDLSELEWSGGPKHVEALAEAIGLRLEGRAELLLVTAGRRAQTVGCGAVDYRKAEDAGELWMLSVHPAWQSLGVGTVLIGALEDRIRERGLPRARLGVEHDNPRAHALYRRLGYVDDGTELDGWGEGGGRTYVTVCTMMTKPLA